MNPDDNKLSNWDYFRSGFFSAAGNTCGYALLSAILIGGLCLLKKFRVIE